MKKYIVLFISILAILIAAFFLYNSFQSEYRPGLYPISEEVLDKGSEGLDSSQIQTQSSPPENMPQFPALYQSKGILEAVVIYDEPSLYGRVTVYDYKDRRTLMINGAAQGTWGFKKNKAEEPYIYQIDVFFQNYLKDIKDVLIIGVGGGTLLKEWEGEGFEVDVVEINPKVVEVTKKYFALPENLDYKIITDDGRHFLRTTDKKYDAIVLDICEILEHNAHLWTDEFFKLAKSKLKKDSGFLIVSLYMMSEDGPYSAGHMVANTLKENFKNVYVVGDPSSGFSIINFFVSDESIDISSIQGLQIEEWEFNPSYPIITDKDVAKIVQYHYPILELLREATIKNFGISFLLEP